MVGHSTPKAQSAMEYLMTYGWAILIISVVLGALFSLGVFSGSTLIGTSCIAAPGYSCSGELLLTTGTFNVLVGQNTGATEYNAFVTVVGQGSALSSVGFPTQGVVFPSSGNGIAFTAGSTNTVTVTLTSTQVPGGFTLSSTFTGYLWLNYSTVSGGVANSAIKIATVNVKVT